jgi:saccharopine dehydrogenase-like NADP-dependent oxidoreductase
VAAARVLVCGAGAVGARAARHLLADDGVESILVADSNRKRRMAVVASLGPRAAPVDEPDPRRADLVVVATPAGRQVDIARRAVAAGVHVVSTADSVASVQHLLDLDAEARERDVVVAVGAGFSPGLSCLLACHAGAELEAVDEIHVSKHGTGGPACARQHHAALRGAGLDWRDHAWRRRPPGSGRELSFFPDPIGGADCYRASLPDGLLLVPAFPGVARVTARLAATRRDRFTASLPMLRPPHAEGRIGGLRVEVRGRRGIATDTVVLGAVDRPAVAAGTVAGLTARWIAGGRVTARGAAGLASLVEPLPFLRELARTGVRAAVFEGS